MKQYFGEITENKRITKSTFIISCRIDELASSIKPGQFCNIKVSDTYIPLLRRPFSVSDVNKDIVSFMVSIHGKGTEMISQKRIGEKLDILGPLGNSFNLDENFDVALIVSGGIGIAPFPYLLKKLKHKQILSFFGFRTENEIINIGISNPLISTDDGSFGIKGNVIDLLIQNVGKIKSNNSKIFACGPNPMLKAVQEFCKNYNINGEISTESAMACGFGICQGCPIETHEENKYKLICKDGPIFNVKEVKL